MTTSQELNTGNRINLHVAGPSIPLSPEILQEAGFKFERCGISGADMWQGMPFWTKGDIVFRGYISTAKGGTLHLANYWNTQIRYVHQLQNLYFALTGEELEIAL